MPNIIGYVGDLDRWREGHNNSKGLNNPDIMTALGASGKTNPFYTSNQTVYKDGKDGDAGNTKATALNLSRYNAAYGRREEVAPENYTIRIWKRTA